MSAPQGRSEGGLLAWAAGNPVAANLAMLFLLVGGLMTLPKVKQEVFPEVELDTVNVRVAYPGASPKEVEQGVTLAVEEAVRAVEGIEEIQSTAAEGAGVTSIQLRLGTDRDRALADIKSAIDRIVSFPADVERPIVSLASNRQQVISLVFYGDQDEKTLRKVVEDARDELLEDPRVTQAELSGVRPLEIAVEVPRANLRKFGLTIDGIARSIQRASIDVPAGGIRSARGEVLLRTKARRDSTDEFRDVVLISRPDGSQVRVGDIAEVRDGFREVDKEAYYNGKRAVILDVLRVGEDTPVAIAKTARRYAKTAARKLPPGIGVATWRDSAEIFEQRIDLLERNAIFGLILVFAVLALFLELKLAFWVAWGIPTSFIGSMLLFPVLGVSINMISLFAFIVTLGMVVDDAIVVGEAIYHRRTQGEGLWSAAVMGVRDVALPVVFSILTTCIAFAPMLFVPGVSGQFFRVIPIVVILVLLISLVEALLILPAHLAETPPTRPEGRVGGLLRKQQAFSRAVERFIERRYAPLLRKALRNSSLTLALAIALLFSAFGLVAGGRLPFTFMPKIDGDVVIADLRMPFGTPVDESRRYAEFFYREAVAVSKELGGGKGLHRGILAKVGTTGSLSSGPLGDINDSGSHLMSVMVYLVGSDRRTVSSSTFAKRWRERVGEIPGAETLSFEFSTGASPGAPIDFRLSHRDEEALEGAARTLADSLRDFQGVYDIDDGFAAGKEQLDFRLKAEGRALGLSESDLATQVRSAFFGAEALRQQRGRDEVRVFVRLPAEERRSLHTVEQMLLQTPQGGEVPLGQAAWVERGRSYTAIQRTNARRTANVRAQVFEEVANANQIVAELKRRVLPRLMRDVPGLSYEMGGEQREQKRILSNLGRGFSLALFGMFALLAVAFRSYIQPLIVLLAIPYGMVGALVGHVLLGYSLSLMSMMGLVALSGVVVNDSIVFVDAVNEFRRQGISLEESLVLAGTRRFRPILLTSLTTFFGVMPMIAERSLQARFLIPMTISLGFGVLFATFITLLVVPVYYRLFERLRLKLRPGRETPLPTQGVQSPGE